MNIQNPKIEDSQYEEDIIKGRKKLFNIIYRHLNIYSTKEFISGTDIPYRCFSYYLRRDTRILKEELRTQLIDLVHVKLAQDASPKRGIRTVAQFHSDTDIINYFLESLESLDLPDVDEQNYSDRDRKVINDRRELFILICQYTGIKNIKVLVRGVNISYSRLHKYTSGITKVLPEDFKEVLIKHISTIVRKGNSEEGGEKK